MKMKVYLLLLLWCVQSEEGLLDVLYAGPLQQHPSASTACFRVSSLGFYSPAYFAETAFAKLHSTL